MKRKKKNEAQRFKELLDELGYEGIGGFLELVGGLVAMVDGDEEDFEAAKQIAGPLSMQIGFMIERLGFLERIIEKNQALKEELEGEKKGIELDIKDNPELMAAVDRAVQNIVPAGEKK